MNSDQIIRSAFFAMLALGVSGVSGTALAAKTDMEKCAGVVKAGKNDCGTSKNSCAGQVKTDADSEAWISVPKGTCERIVGAHVVTK